jgi:hypothetical protein
MSGRHVGARAQGILKRRGHEDSIRHARDGRGRRGHVHVARWCPDEEAGQAGCRRARAAARPAAEISVMGLRIIGSGLGKNRDEIRAFNESPGVAVALAIKMPAGQGIVQLDEDNCVLTSVTDDAGTDLGEQAKYGSFPKTSDDGSVGMIEIESRLRPAAGATAVLAEGTLVFSVSPGSKPTKIASVKLEKGKSFKLGTATVTLSEVTPGEEHGDRAGAAALGALHDP